MIIKNKLYKIKKWWEILSHNNKMMISFQKEQKFGKNNNKRNNNFYKDKRNQKIKIKIYYNQMSPVQGKAQIK